MKKVIKLNIYWFLRLIYILKKLSFSDGFFQSKKIKKILLIETALLGDVITSTPLCRTIATKFPGAKVTMLIQGKYKPLLQNNPYINNLETLDKINLRSFCRIILKLRRNAFDLVVSVSPGVRNSLLSLFIGRSFITGYLVNYSLKTYYFQDYFIESVGIKGKWLYDKNEHITVRALKTLLPLRFGDRIIKSHPELFILPNDEKHYLNILISFDFIKTYHVNIIIHPGAAWPFRRWSVHNFISLIDNLMRRYSTKINITLIGISSEKNLLEEIKRGVSSTINSLISNNLQQTMVLIKNCDLFIGNDSGPKFIADAFNRPLVELLGPLMPESVAAITDGAVTIYHNVKCNPCPQQNCVNDSLCMKSITVEEVNDAVNNIIDLKFKNS